MSNRPFDPADWYWFVGGDGARVYASARRAYVGTDDPAFRAWSADALPSRIVSEAELRDVLAAYGRALLPGDPPPPPPRDIAAELDALKTDARRAKAAEEVLISKAVVTRKEIDDKVPDVPIRSGRPV